MSLFYKLKDTLIYSFDQIYVTFTTHGTLLYIFNHGSVPQSICTCYVVNIDTSQVYSFKYIIANIFTESEASTLSGNLFNYRLIEINNPIVINRMVKYATHFKPFIYPDTIFPNTEKILLHEVNTPIGDIIQYEHYQKYPQIYFTLKILCHSIDKFSVSIYYDYDEEPHHDYPHACQFTHTYICNYFTLKKGIKGLYQHIVDTLNPLEDEWSDIYMYIKSAIDSYIQ